MQRSSLSLIRTLPLGRVSQFIHGQVSARPLMLAVRLMSTISSRSSIPSIDQFNDSVNKNNVQDISNILATIIQTAPIIGFPILTSLLNYLDQCTNATLDNVQKIVPKVVDVKVLSALYILISLRRQELSQAYSGVNPDEKNEVMDFITKKINSVCSVYYNNPTTSNNVKLGSKKTSTKARVNLDVSSTIKLLVKTCDDEGVSALRDVCYILATAMIESKMGTNMDERTSKTYCITHYGGKDGNCPDPSEDGYTYRGRGFAQLTHRDNYIKAQNYFDVNKAIGDFDNDPDLLKSNRALAARVIVKGMQIGLFYGSVSLDLRGYDRILMLSSTDTIPTVFDQKLIVIQIKGDKITAYWKEDNKVTSKTFCKSAINKNIKQLPLAGKYSKDTMLIKYIVLQFNCNQSQSSLSSPFTKSKFRLENYPIPSSQYPNLPNFKNLNMFSNMRDIVNQGDMRDRKIIEQYAMHFFKTIVSPSLSSISPLRDEKAFFPPDIP